MSQDLGLFDLYDSAKAAAPIPKFEKTTDLDLPRDHFKKIWERIPCDCIIVVAASKDAPEERIECHFPVVSYFSELISSLSESHKERPLVIPAPANSTAKCVRFLFSIMYNCPVEIPEEDLPSLLFTSEAFKATFLTKKISARIWSSANAVGHMLKIACEKQRQSQESVMNMDGEGAAKGHEEEMTKLFNDCLQFFESTLENCQVLSRPDIAPYIPSSIMIQILSSKSLPATELDVFGIALDWARAQTGKDDKSSALSRTAQNFALLYDCIDWSKIGFSDLRTTVYEAQVLSQEKLLECFRTCQEEDSNTRCRNGQGSYPVKKKKEEKKAPVASSPSGGCGPDCTRDHSGATCLVCGRSWGPHFGHNCTTNGGRGSFPI